MTPFEAATGWLTGEAPAIPVDAGPADTADPIVVLESLLVSALAHPPCVVVFSGGRDSSALLAVATRLAAREGFPAPAAVTLRYPSERPVEEEGWAEEARWQERVVRYLGVADWERIPVGDDADLLGPIAAERLLRHGLLWPPAYHTTVPVLRLASGGTVLTGDGGDEIFGERRTTPLVRLLSGHRPRNRVRGCAGGSGHGSTRVP